MALDTLFIGSPLHHQTQVDSTNTWAALEVQRGGITEGTVFMADYQTHGRGQRGRQWESAVNQNLLMSLVLKPTFLSLQEQFQLTMAMAIALRDMVAKVVPGTVTIKWPNDIYVGDLKVAGILTEAAAQGMRMSDVIVGVGLNINQTQFDPLVNGTSLLLETGVRFTIPEIFNQLCVQMEKRYMQLRNGNMKWLAHYEQHLYKHGEKQVFDILHKGHQEMTIIGVQKNGQLKLADSYKKVRSYQLHEARMVV